MNSRIFTRSTAILAATVALTLAIPVRAGVGSGGGTGVLDVDTPEMLPPGWMSFSSTWRLNSIKIDDRRLHTFVASPNVTIGLNGGLEAAASLPLNAFYRTDAGDDEVSSLFDENFRMRIGDLQMKLKTGVPLGGDRIRMGLEALASAPTGSDRVEELYAPGDSIRPFTSGEWNIGAVGLLTMDLTGPNGIPVRVHANGGYYWNRDEASFTYRNGYTYPLPIVMPDRSEANDLMILSAAAEFPVFKQAAFVEVSTEQFVNARSLVKTSENPILLTPGLRFNLPGGVGLTSAVAFNLSKDSDKTDFNPDDIFPDWEARAVLSFGDIFQSRKSRLERRQRQQAPTHAPIFVQTAPKEDTGTGVADPVAVSQSPKVIAPKVAAAPSPAQSPALRPGLPNDTDGDGVPDDVDRCPLRKEDLDGFRDGDGCPDPDNDQDGILDVDDLCPNASEDHRGPRPLDGCPMGFDESAQTIAIKREVLDSTMSSAAPAGGVSAQPMTSESIAAAIRDAATEMNARPGSQTTASSADPFKDTDQDGVPDIRDLCPTTPEDLDGFDDLDGCPELDNDGDGFVDSSDRCPNAGETWNGYKDDDGCPDTAPSESSNGMELSSVDGRLADIERSLARLATDRELSQSVAATGSSVDVTSDIDDDGVSDRFDRCPEIPEDVDGWLDEDGCPDLDNDGDGIRDRNDNCPNAAETWNGFEDEDGCPDVAPGSAQLADPKGSGAATSPQPSMAPAPTMNPTPQPAAAPTREETIFFSTGGSRLPADALPRLDALASRVQNSQARLDIRGFSDSKGSNAANQRLSLERAEAVRSYLIARGLDPSRMTTQGMGDLMPIGDNQTAEGRARNRRVEVFVIS